MEILPETTKPFKLVKYFFWSSFIFMLIFVVSLALLITQRSKEALLKKTETFAIDLAKNLNHQVFFNFVLPMGLQRKEVRLRDPQQFKWLDQIVRITIFSFKIEKVNMYDPLNIIAYSTDRSLVGKKNLGGTDYKKAMTGKYSSRFISEEGLLKIRPGREAPSRKIITTIPFRVDPSIQPNSPILGVFEITQDISKDYEGIIWDQYLMVFFSIGLMTLLYLILLFIVKRGEVIMERKAQEQKRLEDKLHQAERMASLGEMIASVSHEIKNPLGIIRSTADLLEKKVIQIDPQNQLASVIREEADRLNRIVTEFLDFARPQIPKMEPVRIETILEKNLHFLGPELAFRRIEVQKDFIPGLQTILVDQDLLYRAFLNILLNSVQAMSEGGRIGIKVRYLSREAIIEINDSGAGLSEEERTKAFQPFFTTKEKGSGLGLAIVKNIVEAHRGTIQMVNSESGGTSVVITLPNRKE
ncbi:MAG: GHKL domain-containing protein [Deltaproteobacteria bacterium]|nr:GHKL domain-containing protein [Deltaproteobacteria bacterium]